jgi:hypothetical protein
VWDDGWLHAWHPDWSPTGWNLIIFDGLIGSVVSTLVAVLVALWVLARTKEHERALATETAVRHEVGEILVASGEVARGVASGSEGRVRDGTHLMYAGVIRLSMVIGRDWPALAAWATEQMQRGNELILEGIRRNEPEEIVAAIREISLLGSVLAGWVELQFPKLDESALAATVQDIRRRGDLPSIDNVRPGSFRQ